jgi:hypothetical protein
MYLFLEISNVLYGFMVQQHNSGYGAEKGKMILAYLGYYKLYATSGGHNHLTC